MKKNYRIIPFLVLIFTLTLSLAVFAKTDEEVIKRVSDAGIMTGTNNGFEGEKTLTRAEVATIVVRMKGMEDEAISDINYVDVSKDFWAYKYISIATKEGITKGTGVDTFTPQRTVTVGETVTMLVRAIAGQEDIDRLEKQSWPNNYMTFAKNKKLLDGISTTKHSEEISRMDTARIIGNILEVVYGVEEQPKKENNETKARASAGIIVSVAQLADDMNEVELATPGKVVELIAHNNELGQGLVLPGTYVTFWLTENVMWDIVPEQKVTDVKSYEHLAKVIDFGDGVIRFVRKPTDPATIINVNATEYVAANSLVYLKCDEMILNALGTKDPDTDEDLWLREFDNLRMGSEFEIELTDDYNEGLTYDNLDGTEVYYLSYENKKGEEIIAAMIYVED